MRLNFLVIFIMVLFASPAFGNGGYDCLIIRNIPSHVALTQIDFAQADVRLLMGQENAAAIIPISFEAQDYFREFPFDQEQKINLSFSQEILSARQNQFLQVILNREFYDIETKNFVEFSAIQISSDFMSQTIEDFVCLQIF